MSEEYQFGGRSDEREHGVRELEQLRLGYCEGSIGLFPYMNACDRIREKYDLALADVNTGP